MKYLIDTDWIIDHLNGVEVATNAIGDLMSDGIAVSILSVAELYEGVYGSPDPDATGRTVERFLSRVVEVLPIDDETARLFGRERARLRAAGRLIGDVDLLIATTALRFELVVLTNNRRHFEQVDGLTVVSAQP